MCQESEIGFQNTQMRILFMKNNSKTFLRKSVSSYTFIFFFISVCIQAQVFDNNTSIIYISKGAFIIENHNQQEDSISKPKHGKLYIYENVVLSNNDKLFSVEIVNIGKNKTYVRYTTKEKTLVFRRKKQLKNEVVKPIKKTESIFNRQLSDANINIDFPSKKIITSTSNTQIISLTSRFSDIIGRLIIYGQTISRFYRKFIIPTGNDLTRLSIRPPPIII